MIVILPKEKPLWMTCKNLEFIKWYKKYFPKQFEKEFLEWATPKEYAEYCVNKMFKKISDEEKNDHNSSHKTRI